MKRRKFLQSAGVAATALPVVGCSIMSQGYQPSGTMPERVLGKTGLKVSRLSFGSHLRAALKKNPKLRDRMIRLGFDCGINTFDIYEHRGYEQFEPMRKSLNGIRKKVNISLVSVVPAKDMQAEIDDALTKLQTDYIDLHRLWNLKDEGMTEMDKMKKAGKIRFIGLVSHDADELMSCVDRYKNSLDFVMIIYNFHHNTGRPNNELFHTNDYSALIPHCKSLNLGVIGIKPMGSDNMIELATDKGFFKDKKANVAQAMLRYAYQFDEIDTVMPAMNNLKDVTSNLEATYNPAISSYEKNILDKLSKLASITKRKYLEVHYKWLENWATRVA